MIAPSEEDVDNVIGILGLGHRDRALVSSALQAKNNSVEQVVNEYFDSPEKFHQQYSWDESAFAAGRDGTAESDIPSFSIHPADSQVIQGVDPNYYSNSVAPSRPPSRTNSRSPLSKLADYTANYAPAMNQPTNSEQENADIQRAIAESVATSGIQSPQPVAPQESGIIQGDTSLPYFGPANRPEYDQNQWAMITLNREVPEPGPSRRKRDPGTPAFLRCRKEQLWEKHRLGAILSILHAVPAARNALLRLGSDPVQGYGHNTEWWMGQPILRPGAPSDNEVACANDAWPQPQQPVWFEELRRLMAFLDATERSYGTADALAESTPDGYLSSGDAERDFFEYIRGGPDPTVDDKILPMSSTAEVVPVVGDGPSLTNHWGVLEPSFPREQLMAAENLYNIWDMIFFMDARLANDLEEARMATITQPADVMTIRFRGEEGFPKPIEIPRVFYIDRYLAAHKDAMSQLQRDMVALSQSVVRGLRAEELLTRFVDPATGKTVDRRALCSAAIARNRQRLWRLKAIARWESHQDARERGEDPQYFSMDRDERDPDGGDVELNAEESNIARYFEADIRFYQQKIAEIERKLQKVNAEKKACEEVFRELGNRFTVPSEEQQWNPTHSYTLRGVSNSPDVFYVCVRSPAPDSMDTDGDEGSSSQQPSNVATDQWWKLGYVADDEEPVKAEMTTYEKATEEACGVGSKPILVYASEKAMGEAPESLSEALRTFVRFDNRLFRQELKDESPQDKKRGPFGSPSSPSKRLNRSASLDSMATNVAFAGDLDDDMRDAHFEVDDPFEAGDGSSMETELQDLSSRKTDDPAVALGTGSRGDQVVEPAGRADGSPDEAATAPLPNGVALEQQQREQQPDGQPTQVTAGIPEMEERGGALPFLVQPATGRKAGNDGPIAMMDMELDDYQETR